MPQAACVVIDVGTAVSDFIDGEGVFHGGVIAPGAQMQPDALHERTTDSRSSTSACRKASPSAATPRRRCSVASPTGFGDSPGG